jgi:sugar phosphate isomerase/epimerase
MSTRRELLKSITIAAVAGGARQLRANPLGLPIGCQTYPVRKMIAKDFPGTVKVLIGAGFQNIELCSPWGYADSGFAPVGKYSGAELKKLLSDLGVRCFSSHFGMDELRKNMPARLDWAKDAGLTQMFVPSLDGPKNPTMDDVKRVSDEFNKMGEQTRKAGIQLGLHNEGFEVGKVDGQRTYDVLMKLLDPKLIKFQFQVSTIADGFDAAEYFTKYPGRFISMHVQGWSATDHKIVAVGEGTLDWKKIFSAAKTGGIQNYFVEMDLPLMQTSVPYLRQLQV